MRAKRLEHGWLGEYVKVAATNTCTECQGPLERPVPHDADFDQRCSACLLLLQEKAAWCPKSRLEHEAAERWQAWLLKKFPPDGQMVRRKAKQP